MRELYNIAELVVASWKLANDEERLPTSQGILDRALKKLVESDTLPKWVSENLTFADTRIGLRCLELPEILDCAQESQLTSVPNYTYETTVIKVDEPTCLRLIRDLDIHKSDAETWGSELRKAVNQVLVAASATEEHETSAIA